MRSGFFIQTGIRGVERNQALKIISSMLPSSIVLFKSDFNNEAELQGLIKDIQKLYAIEKGIAPPVFAIDQEGGNVVRIPWLNYNPSNYFLGQVNNEKLTNYIGLVTGNDLYRLGIRWNLAPVLDILNNYNQVLLERSFGEDVETVAVNGAAYISGLQNQGVAATAKHFPGHGGVLEDSHQTLPRDKRSMNALLNDAFPFKAAIKAGVRAVMLSHVLYEELDPDNPATLSQKAYDLLRKTFQFNGLVITDSVDMKAVSQNYSTTEIVSKSVELEADLIECADLQTSIELSDSIQGIDSDKLKKKIERISSFLPEKKVKFKPPSEVLQSFSIISNRAFRQIYIDPGKHFYVVLLDNTIESQVAEEHSIASILAKSLKENYFDFTLMDAAAFRGFNIYGIQMIIVGRNEHLKDRISSITEKCGQNRCVFISTSISKDTGIIPENIGYIAAYSSKPENVLGAIYRAMKFF